MIVGTDTGVGKTLVSGRLLKAYARLGYHVVGMKPVASGAYWQDDHWRHDDVSQLLAASTIVVTANDICPYFLKDPIAPSIAADRQQISISLDVIEDAYLRLVTQADYCVVETAGGLLAPLDNQVTHTMLSIGERLQLPVVMVVGIRLGAINHALLTYQTMKAANLTVLGWVANRIEDERCGDQDAVIELLSRQIDAPLLADIPYMPEKQTGNITTGQKKINWILPDIEVLRHNG